MIQEFFSNGKLLLSGEYAVLDGALAWAIPTKYGQYLQVTSNESSQLSWKSLNEKGNIWFEGKYDPVTLKERSSSDNETSKALQKILLEARQLNPNFLSNPQGFDIETKLFFPKNWGLGSSSTLINNIANWANVNAQELLSSTFGGSGYDIACAQHDKPILYQITGANPFIKEIEFNLSFSNQLYFVYLNQKKNSRDAIVAYRERTIDKVALIKKISELTYKMSTCADITDFRHLMNQHEALLSEALGIPPIQSKLFPDYTGAIKSLGAWGGDFILATGEKNPLEYFAKKGYQTVIPFKDMIL